MNLTLILSLILSRSLIPIRSPATAADAETCGRICHEAFTALAEHHRFPSDFPEPETGISLVTMLISHPGFYGVVAELEGRVVGSNFMDERSTMAGIGPITIDPGVQNKAIGRRLMEDVMARSDDKGFPGLRLLQATFHNRSLGLYSKLGFEARDLVSTIQGPAIGKDMPGHAVRPATIDDMAACNDLAREVHGHDRAGELADALGQGTASLVERDGGITGYSTSIAFFGHTVAKTNGDLKALIAAAAEFGGPGFLLPTRNGEVLRWCFAEGLRIVQPLTLMTRGEYRRPELPYMPSILY